MLLMLFYQIELDDLLSPTFRSFGKLGGGRVGNVTQPPVMSQKFLGNFLANTGMCVHVCTFVCICRRSPRRRYHLSLSKTVAGSMD